MAEVRINQTKNKTPNARNGRKVSSIRKPKTRALSASRGLHGGRRKAV